MAHNPKLYHPKWSLIGRLIRRRAGGACEWCRARDRYPNPRTGSVVHLAVAHIDRDRHNNRFTNLAALCERCHLTHDAPQHVRSRQAGVDWALDQYWLELEPGELAMAVAAGQAVLLPRVRWAVRLRRPPRPLVQWPRPQLLLPYGTPVLIVMPALTRPQLAARRRSEQQKALTW